jgi:hypothetical protein
MSLFFTKMSQVSVTRDSGTLIDRKEIGPETAQEMRFRDPALWKVLLESLNIGFGSSSMSFQGLHEIVLGYAISWFRGSFLSSSTPNRLLSRPIEGCTFFFTSSSHVRDRSRVVLFPRFIHSGIYFSLRTSIYF